MNFRSTSDLDDVVVANLHRFGDVTAVIGVPRSGVVPAALFSLYLNVEFFTSVAAFAAGSSERGSTRPTRTTPPGSTARVLLVDDSSNTGAAMAAAVAELRRSVPDVASETLVVYGTDRSQRLVDHVLEVVPQPRLFQWNLFHHPKLSDVAVELDGLLCPPLPTESNHAVAAGRARDAAAVIVPTFEMGLLLTTRPRMLNGVTWDWLGRTGIATRSLVHVDETLRAVATARAYAESDLQLLVVGDDQRAREIEAIVDKPVVSWAPAGRSIVGGGPAKAPLRVRLALRERMRGLLPSRLR